MGNLVALFNPKFRRWDSHKEAQEAQGANVGSKRRAALVFVWPFVHFGGNSFAALGLNCHFRCCLCNGLK